MISRILAADLPAKAGQQVMIAGWLHRKRQLKSMTFLIVRDRSGLAQAVLTDPAAIQAAARSSGPSRTTPPGTWLSTPAWTLSLASSPAATTSWRCCGTRSPEWWRQWTAALVNPWIFLA
jgi:hypothetical protein